MKISQNVLVLCFLYQESWSYENRNSTPHCRSISSLLYLLGPSCSHFYILADSEVHPSFWISYFPLQCISSSPWKKQDLRKQDLKVSKSLSGQYLGEIRIIMLLQGNKFSRLPPFLSVMNIFGKRTLRPTDSKMRLPSLNHSWWALSSEL